MYSDKALTTDICLICRAVNNLCDMPIFGSAVMFGKPKKLKRIPVNLVSYIQIETEAINDFQRQADDFILLSE